MIYIENQPISLTNIVSVSSVYIENQPQQCFYFKIYYEGGAVVPLVWNYYSKWDDVDKQINMENKINAWRNLILDRLSIYDLSDQVKQKLNKQ